MSLTIERGISVREENKPGVLSRVTDAIAQENLNVYGFNATANDKGRILLYVENPQKAKEALENFDFDVREEEFVVADVKDQVGKLAELTTPISEDRIDLKAAFATISGDQATIILQTSANRKTLDLLEEHSL